MRRGTLCIKYTFKMCYFKIIKFVKTTCLFSGETVSGECNQAGYLPITDRHQDPNVDQHKSSIK